MKTDQTPSPDPNPWPPPPSPTPPSDGKSFGMANVVWQALIAGAVTVTLAYMQYQNTTAVQENKKAVEASSEAAAEHSKKLTAAVQENTEATQAIPTAAAVAADKIVGAKIEEKRMDAKQYDADEKE